MSVYEDGEGGIPLRAFTQRVGEGEAAALMQAGGPAPPVNSAWSAAHVIIIVGIVGVFVTALLAAIFSGDSNAKQDDILSLLRHADEPTCGIKGFQDNATGCFYSKQAYVDVRNQVGKLVGDYIAPVLWWIYNDFAWDAFSGKAKVYYYSKTPNEKASNPYLQAANSAIAALDALIADPELSDFERANARVSRPSYALWRDLAELNFLQTEYGSGRWLWSTVPWGEDNLHRIYLPFFSSMPDYDDRVLAYMEDLAAKMPLRTQYYNDVLTKDSPPHVEASITQEWWSGFVANVWGSPDFMKPICDAMSDAGKKASCLAASASRDAEATIFAALYNGDYATACATWRPAAAPGIGQVHNGNETYAAWVRYHNGGKDFTPEEIIAAGEAAVQEIRDEINALHGSVFPGEEFEDYVARAVDLDDPTYTVCFDTQEEATRYIAADILNISAGIYPELQHHSRQVHQIVFTGSCCGWTAGTFDANRNMWTEPASYRYGNKGVNSADQVCLDRQMYGLTLHETLAGHGLQIPLETQLVCPFESKWTRFTGYTEGYAHYSEQICIWTDLCDDPLQEVHGFWNARMLRALRLIVDPKIQTAAMDPSECAAFYVANGISIVFAQEECAERYPQYYGQATGYRLGSDVFSGLRMHAENALGDNFVPAEFNNLLVRFGIFAFDDLEALVNTYIVWSQNRDNAKGMPFFDLLDKQFYKRCDPVVGPGFEIPGGGVVQPASVSSATGSVMLDAAVDISPEIRQMLDALLESRAIAHRVPLDH